MSVVRAAAVQMSPVLYSREGTVEKVVRKVRELGRQGVQFVTFPETVVPYYPYFSFVQTPVQNISGPEQRKLIEQAAADKILDNNTVAGVEIRIVDSGFGMTQDTMRRAFDPFFTTNTKGLGGLGLPMVKRFVLEAGGRIHIESEPGVGTKVMLQLPVTEAMGRRGARERAVRLSSEVEHRTLVR